ncbi:MAG: hypothetical protein RMK29_04000 [Myxococcales bacterium]|nr:hypothetical protein [Myxococcota bacterium]MDW8280850.1 hypothetical protein [Myxococcales bacterium]
MIRPVPVVPLLLCSCLVAPTGEQGDGPTGLDGGGSSRDGGAGAPLFAALTFVGCAELHQSEGIPLCQGVAPLTVRLVPITSGGDQFRWQVRAEDGHAGDPLLSEEQSRQRSPRLRLDAPGRYGVSLAVGGSGGTALATGVVVVQPAPLGARCQKDLHCQQGLRCLCRPDGSDGLCPGGLAAGLCTRDCPCPPGSLCLDLSQGIPAADGGVVQGWRQPMCVPGCQMDKDCREDLLCRELPVQAGAARFAAVCFAGLPGAVGDSCATPRGDPDAAACATAHCEPLGARNLCTAACDPNRRDCPDSAACARWNGGPGAPTSPLCLPRCDAMRPCLDPLLQCQPEGGAGALGFRLPGEPAGTQVCAPRRCTGPADCKGGRCTPLGGASFCLR